MLDSQPPTSGSWKLQVRFSFQLPKLGNCKWPWGSSLDAYEESPQDPLSPAVFPRRALFTAVRRRPLPALYEIDFCVNAGFRGAWRRSCPNPLRRANCDLPQVPRASSLRRYNCVPRMADHHSAERLLG